MDYLETFLCLLDPRFGRKLKKQRGRVFLFSAPQFSVSELLVKPASWVELKSCPRPIVTPPPSHLILSALWTVSQLSQLSPSQTEITRHAQTVWVV